MSASVRLSFLELVVGEERLAADRQSGRKMKTKFAMRLPSNIP